MKQNLIAPALLAASLLSGTASAQVAERPKLVLVIVVDQFRYDYTTRFRADYHGGLARMLDQGAVFTDARYVHFPTVTAVGHSTVMSGATPSVSGIIGNDWYDRVAAKSVTSVSDDEAKLVGGVPGVTGSSPRKLLVSTFADELKMAGRAAKVVGISIKDRSAILPVGHTANGAYWFDNDSGHWVTSSYYTSDLPQWVQQLNAGHPTGKYLGADWLPLRAKEGAKPYCSLVAGKGDVPYCGSIEATPFGNELIEEMAEQALVNEQLGKHSGTDVLAVSFSSNDYAGHALGPDHPAIRDISIRTDILLGKLMDAIDAQVGAGNTLAVLTADHGVAPTPEDQAARNMPGGRIDPSAFAKSITNALNAKFGDGKWIVSDANNVIYLDYKTVADKKADPAVVRLAAADAARVFPHIARVYTRDALLEGDAPVDAVGRAVKLGFYGPRSGDVTPVPEPYWFFSTGSTGTTHSTPYGYDNHVPMLWLGSGIKPGVYNQSATVNDIAPTLAAIFAVETPSGSSGRILREILK